MRTIAEFIKTTLIGGLLIVLPVYIAVLLILKALQGLVTAVKPITVAIPGSVKFEEILAILILAAICFIAGLIVRTRAGLRAKNVIERRVLQRLPGYTLLRGLTGRVMGEADDPAFAPCLAEIEEALVPALIVEELENVPLRCWCLRCRRQWLERYTSCRQSGCIRLTCHLPQHSGFLRNGVPGPVSSSEPWKRVSHPRPRRRRPEHRHCRSQ